MSDGKKKVGIEEICLGHLCPSDNAEFLKERLTVSYNLRKEKTESLQEFLDRRMPKECQFAVLTGNDYTILRGVWGVKEMPACGYCTCDENNNKCHFYQSVRMHIYLALSTEEPEKKE